MSESEQKNADRAASSPASSPDELVKELGATLSDEDQKNVKGGASDIFAKLGDIKGESMRTR
jgi:hypothetical protein